MYNNTIDYKSSTPLQLFFTPLDINKYSDESKHSIVEKIMNSTKKMQIKIISELRMGQFVVLATLLVVIFVSFSILKAIKLHSFTNTSSSQLSLQKEQTNTITTPNGWSSVPTIQWTVENKFEKDAPDMKASVVLLHANDAAITSSYIEKALQDAKVQIPTLDFQTDTSTTDHGVFIREVIGTFDNNNNNAHLITVFLLKEHHLYTITATYGAGETIKDQVNDVIMNMRQTTVQNLSSD